MKTIELPLIPVIIQRARDTLVVEVPPQLLLGAVDPIGKQILHAGWVHAARTRVAYHSVQLPAQAFQIAPIRH